MFECMLQLTCIVKPIRETHVHLCVCMPNRNYYIVNLNIKIVMRSVRAKLIECADIIHFLMKHSLQY